MEDAGIATSSACRCTISKLKHLGAATMQKTGVQEHGDSREGGHFIIAYEYNFAGEFSGIDREAYVFTKLKKKPKCKTDIVVRTPTVRKGIPCDQLRSGTHALRCDRGNNISQAQFGLLCCGAPVLRVVHRGTQQCVGMTPEPRFICKPYLLFKLQNQKLF